MTQRRGEDGYAMVAAVAAMAMLATIAVALVERNRAEITMAQAELDQAKASAAADAGLAIAIDGLLSRDRASRWPIDGRASEIAFGSASLTIRIEDERGKVPLNLLDDQTAARLVRSAGLSGERADIAAQSLLDWLDEDDIARPAGAEAGFYAGKGVRVRNGPLRSTAELAQIRGFDAASAERIQPYVTVHFGAGQFEVRHASPQAIAVMLENGANGTAAIERARELSGQRTAIELGEPGDLAGHPLTVAVEARIGSRAKVQRRSVIELTGSAVRPYIVRSAS